MFKNKLEFKGAIIGTLLGDASLIKRESGSSYLKVTHCKKDQEYLYYKANILNWLNKTKCSEGISKLNGKEYPYVVATTKSHPLYSSLYEHMYYNGHKTVNEHIMKCLTPLGLALWYQDDGTFAGEQGYRCPYICSHAFNQTENELLSRMIFKKFGITFRVLRKNVKDKTYYWLRLRRKDREKFFEIIKPYIQECMKRKIDDKYYISDKKYFEKAFIKCAICKKEIEINAKSQRTICEECQLSQRNDGHQKYYEEKKKDRKFTCIQCGKTFIRKPGKNTVHCSRKCSGITHSNLYKNKRSNAHSTNVKI
ncbi:MAG: hypothetical protein R6U52_01490 [Kosmotogaceae bacterium]